MEQSPVPFGDEVGLEVLAALKELGDGLSKLADIEAISKTGHPNSNSKQFDILQSINRSIATSRWSDQRQELQLKQMLPLDSSPLPSPEKQREDHVLLKKNSFFVSDDVDGTIHHNVSEEKDNNISEHNGRDTSLISDDKGEVAADRSAEDEGTGSLYQDLEEQDHYSEGDVEDEWDDDDDMGYIAMKISEREFFEMEEESAFRLQLIHQNRDEEDMQDEIVESTLIDVEEDTQDIDDVNIEGDEDCQEEIFENVDDNNVNTFKRGSVLEDELNLSNASSDSNASLPNVKKDFDSLQDSSRYEPDDSEFNQLDEDEATEDSEDSLDDEHENDLEDVEREMGLMSIDGNVARDDNNADDNSVNPPEPPIQGYDSPPSIGRGSMTERSRRISEIMGQKKIRGVDGEHCFFDLKVIFDPYRTGFEEDKHFNPPPGTIVAGRYEVVEVLGQAAFSTALQCVDLDSSQDDEDTGRNQWVCLKVIKNSKDFFDQSLDEIKLLQYINSKGDPNEHHVLQMIDYFYCKEHLFIVSELLRENLYEFQKYIRESGGVEYFTPNRLKRIMKQILEALLYIHSLRLLHCDVKPENIVIKSYSRCDVKLIDFGSSCFITDHLTTYIQSRSYRAPEVILGMSYDYGIDIWSLGGVLAEMHTAYVLFQNDSIATMLSRIQSILGPYPKHMVETSPEAPKYFNLSGIVYERDEEDGSFSLLYPKKTTLRDRLHLPPKGEASSDEELFLDFVGLMLQVDPARRPSAEQLLSHPWLDGVDDLEVAYNIEDANPPLPSEDENSIVENECDS